MVYIRILKEEASKFALSLNFNQEKSNEKIFNYHNRTDHHLLCS